MKAKLPLALLVITVIAGACIYSNNEDYVVEPVPGTPPTFAAGTNLDTVTDPVVTDSLQVFYEASVENGRFYFMDAVLNDLHIFYSDTTIDTFWIQSSLVPDPGSDSLHLYFYYSTNSNSLADIVGVEYALHKKDYALTFEKEER
jgi:hypothetical protein